MGEYNPHVPQILGQEWVGIRDESLTFAPSVNIAEIGNGFTITQDRRLRDARFYTHEIQAGSIRTQARQVSIYPQGLEASSGPIQEVLIPVVNGGMTGSNFSLVSAASVAAALWRSGDNSYIRANYSGGLQELNLFFGVNSYPELSGKRILNVSFVYSGNASFLDSSNETLPFILPKGFAPPSLFFIASSPGSQSQSYSASVYSNTGALSGLSNLPNPVDNTTETGQVYSYLNLGDVTPFWSTSVLPSATNIRLPWRYQDLQRFEPGAANRLRVYMIFQTPDPALFEATSTAIRLDYAALRVLFCEEQRSIYGGTVAPYIQGTNIVPLYDSTNTADPVLPAGDYTAAISWVHPGDVDAGNLVNTTFPKLNALRELYPMPAHPGLQINVPFPLADRLGATFSKQSTLVLPQLTLHTSGGPLTEVHVYGRQAHAQVYETITATQDILDAPAGGAQAFPWVRFYARRFGETAMPLVLDSPSIVGSSVQITPAEWDELDEIVDGWKEITLRFDTPPTMGAGTTPQWRWSAAGENVGNRWEVLGVTAPALSGIPGNLRNLVPSPNQLSSATYGAPSDGAAVNLGWVPQYAPTVSVTTDDPTSDAVLIFSQDPPPVSGLTVEPVAQTITGIGLDCGVNPCCIPSELFYHQISWDTSETELLTIVSDDFERTESDTWGDATTGQTWDDSGGAATDYDVASGVGTMAITTVDADRYQLVEVADIPGRTGEMLTTMTLNQVPTGGDVTTTQVFLFLDALNNLRVDLLWKTDQSLELSINSRVAGVGNQVGVTYTGLDPFVANDRIIVRARKEDGRIMARAWHEGDPEPTGWQVEGDIPADQPFANNVGVRSYAAATNTNVGLIAGFDNFSYVIPGEFSIELQRMDTVEPEWQTIMLAANPAISGFNDYEARVGILSSYRIRLVNVYDFPGPWSDTVTSTIPDPGVTIGCGDGHLLIFTSNEEQNGSLNLAYSSVWEGRVEEDFRFSEADFVQLQAMYGRDFFTAFRPTERGGERFQRTVLVQAAAIAPETLGDFTSLRDMAWADVSYICVRDEDGNRWFATVLVPGGKVTYSRKLYMAPVEIIEVTATPSQVSP